MTVEILFILHVANGICIIIHNIIWYNYTYSNMNNKICLCTRILVGISQVYKQI